LQAFTAQWNNLTALQQAPYIAHAVEDGERYARQLAEFEATNSFT